VSNPISLAASSSVAFRATATTATSMSIVIRGIRIHASNELLSGSRKSHFVFGQHIAEM
jgi:hypothetical protein